MRNISLSILAGALGLAAFPAAALADPHDGRGVPRGHLPPPGECRVWYPDRPAGHQPPPTDCRTARRQAYYNGGRVIRGGREGRDERRYRRDRYDDNRGYYDRRRWDRGCDDKDYRKGEC